MQVQVCTYGKYNKKQQILGQVVPININFMYIKLMICLDTDLHSINAVV